MVLGFLVADCFLSLRLALARSYLHSSCRLQPVPKERQAHLVVVSGGGKKSQAHFLREIGLSCEKPCKIGSLTYLQNKPTRL